MRLAALAIVTIATLAAAAASLTESYHAQYVWALRHNETGAWARWWPLQIDVFIVVPELLLFVGIVDRWPWRYRVVLWLTAAAGILASLAANVWHLDRPADRLTFAAPPLAAAATIALGLFLVKRLVNPPAGTGVPLDLDVATAAAAFREQLAAGVVPGIRPIKRELGAGQPRARQVRDQLATYVNGRAHG